MWCKVSEHTVKALLFLSFEYYTLQYIHYLNILEVYSITAAEEQLQFPPKSYSQDKMIISVVQNYDYASVVLVDACGWVVLWPRSVLQSRNIALCQHNMQCNYNAPQLRPGISFTLDTFGR